MSGKFPSFGQLYTTWTITVQIFDDNWPIPSTLKPIKLKNYKKADKCIILNPKKLKQESRQNDTFSIKKK